MRLGIIGGTGIEEPPASWRPARRRVRTPYGTVEAYAVQLQGPLGEERAVFIPRHGPGHRLLPHQVNHKANIRALYSLWVRRVTAATAVGSLRTDFPPGDLVVVDQLLDFTRGRGITFFDRKAAPRHVDFTEPFCGDLRSALAEAASRHGVRIHDGGCYVCTEGPRYETAAEIRMFRALGGDVVGMTAAPEAVLARELGVCYAVLAIVTNLGAGLGGERLEHGSVVRAVAERSDVMRRVMADALASSSRVCSRGCGGVQDAVNGL